MNSKKQWTDWLRDRLSQYETKDVPQGLWDDIENALDAKPGRKPLWLKISGVAAAAAVVFVCGLNMLLRDNNVDTVDNVVSSVRLRQVDGIQRGEQSAQQEKVMAEAPAVMHAYRYRGRTVTDVRKDTVTEYTARTPETDNTPQASATENGDTSGGNDANETPVYNNSEATNRLLAEYGGETDRLAHKHGSGGISVDLYASNLTSSVASMDGYGALAERPVMPKAHGVSPIASPVQTMAYSNRYEEAVTDVRHHMPVRIGLGVRYFFNRHWTVETGIVYSMLESETTSGTDHSYIYADQKIQYAGVPVSVGYQWINTRRLTVYTNMGVQAEFGMAGTLESLCVVEGEPADKKRSDIDNIPMQWSLNAAAGVQYNIIGNLGIYAEPGLAYYINNGSSLRTAYSDKPLNFSMKVGLRYDFKTIKK